jgi:anti-sigma factor RsiW
MECRDVQRLADEFVTGQLSHSTVPAVVAHLEACAACRAEIEGLRRLRAATRAAFENAPELRVRPEFVAKVTAGLRDGAALQPRGFSRRTWFAIAAGTALAVGSGWGWREWSAARLAAVTRAAAGDHRYCAISFALDEKPISLQEAARRFGGVHERLLDVEPSTYVLAGGRMAIVDRHSCVYAGRRFSHIVVRYKEELVSLLVTPHTEFGPTAPSFAALPETDGFHTASLQAADHAVFVVSTLDDGDVLEVASAFTTPLTRALASA